MLVQQADEVDRGRRATCKPRKRRRIVRVAFDDLNGGQQQQMPRTRPAPRQHDGKLAGPCEVCEDVAADESAAAEHEYALATGGHAPRPLTARRRRRRRNRAV